MIGHIQRLHTPAILSPSKSCADDSATHQELQARIFSNYNTINAFPIKERRGALTKFPFEFFSTEKKIEKTQKKLMTIFLMH